MTKEKSNERSLLKDAQRTFLVYNRKFPEYTEMNVSAIEPVAFRSPDVEKIVSDVIQRERDLCMERVGVDIRREGEDALAFICTLKVSEKGSSTWDRKRIVWAMEYVVYHMIEEFLLKAGAETVAERSEYGE